MRLLQGLQDHRDFSIDVSGPAMLEHVAGQPLEDHLEPLAIDLLGLEMVEVEVRHLVRHDAAPHPEVEAPARQMIEHAHFLDEPQRVVERQAVHARPQADPSRPLGRRGEEDAGHRGEAERRGMVLGQVVRVEARRVVLLEQAQPMLVEIGHRHVPPIEVIEDAQVHVPSRGPPPAQRFWWRGRQVAYQQALE
jgi:hypothetical protein